MDVKVIKYISRYRPKLSFSLDLTYNSKLRIGILLENCDRNCTYIRMTLTNTLRRALIKIMILFDTYLRMSTYTRRVVAFQRFVCRLKNLKNKKIILHTLQQARAHARAHTHTQIQDTQNA